jgi:hypothetical protein
MDNSSRNIVIFIATITFAALLLMAARYYADGQKEAAPPTVEEVKTEKTDAATEPTDEEQAALDGEQSEDPENVPEEEDYPMMGEPTVNLEQSNNTGSDAPAANMPQMPETSTAPDPAPNP